MKALPAFLSVAVFFFVSVLPAFAAPGPPPLDADLVSLPPKELAKLVVDGTCIDNRRVAKLQEKGVKANRVLCGANNPEAYAVMKELLFTYGLDGGVKRDILLALGERETRECVDITAVQNRFFLHSFF